jgi:hypothetical protein
VAVPLIAFIKTRINQDFYQTLWFAGMKPQSIGVMTVRLLCLYMQGTVCVGVTFKLTLYSVVSWSSHSQSGSDSILTSVDALFVLSAGSTFT